MVPDPGTSNKYKARIFQKAYGVFPSHSVESEVPLFFGLSFVFPVFNYKDSTIRRQPFFFRIDYGRRSPTQPLIGRGTVHKLGI